MGTCSVCQGESFTDVTWRSHAGAEWPAFECCTCGAITLRKHLEPPRTDAPGRSGARRIEVYERSVESAGSHGHEVTVRFFAVPDFKHKAAR